MTNFLYPGAYVDSAFKIDYEYLWKRGFRGLLFDVDNTLTMHNVDAERREANFFVHLRKLGFKTVILSNNKRERVEPFAKLLKTPFIHRAHKPLSRAYINAMKMIGTNIDNTLFVGDQLYTDIVGANVVGLKSILVRPISSKEAFWIKLKRIIEIPVLAMYKINHKINDINF